MNRANAVSSARMRLPERVIIGEAVTLEVLPASLGVRILSGLIDYTLYGGGLLLSFLTWSAIAFPGTHLDKAQVFTQISFICALWMLLVPISVEALTHGRSAGRIVMGCRVVREDGGSIQFRQTLVRALSAVLEIWLTSGILAICSCALTRRGKRFGDLLAGTYVLREHSGVSSSPPLLMPPELAAWAQQADIRALPGELALIGRTFLQRACLMEAEARANLAQELSAQVSALVTPPPPPGTHPERFLAAVLCERRDRELELLKRDAMQTAAALKPTALPYGISSSHHSARDF